MGYITTFDISVEYNGADPEKVFSAFADISFGDAFADMVLNDGRVEAKWYRWREHFQKLSEKFPEICIEVEGEGERNDDIWRAIFLGGKSQVVEAKLTFEPFKPWSQVA